MLTKVLNKSLKLDENHISENPFIQFEKWFEIAKKVKVIIHPNAMNLATVNNDGQPSSRVVLLKHHDENGFVFYTNYNSRKATELLGNNKASVLFFWPVLERQIRIMGSIEKVSDEMSDSYFALRPRGSQIGAWASNQSSEIENRKAMENMYKQYEEKFKNQEVPRPPHWGGFRLKPAYFEFWQGRPDRFHDRIIYKLEGDNAIWKISRLSP